MSTTNNSGPSPAPSWVGAPDGTAWTAGPDRTTPVTPPRSPAADESPRPFSPAAPVPDGQQPAPGQPPPRMERSSERPLAPPAAARSADRPVDPSAELTAGAGGWGESAPLANAVRQRRTAPRDGWRALVYRATGGRWNPGLSEAEARLRDQLQRIRTPLAGTHSVVVGSIKGGIGKTTVVSLLGLALAEHRGDKVIAIDANPDAGTLGDRLVGEDNASHSTVRDLLDDIDRIRSSTQLAGYTHLAGRLRVVTSEQEPELSEMFSATDYQAVLALLARYFEAIITDSGTGVVHSAMQGSLEHADSLVIVGAPTQDGASRASRTLHWLAAHGYRELAEDAVVVLSCDRHSPFVDETLIREHFRSRCRAVVELPPDPHLATGGLVDLDALTPAARDAALELAATVAEGFHAPRARGLASTGIRAVGTP